MKGRVSGWVAGMALATFGLGWATHVHADGDEAHSELYRVSGQGIGLVSKGVGLATRSNSVKEGGEIQLAGVPAGASVISAHLYWVVFALTPNPAMTFEGQPVAAVHIGTSANSCWQAGWSVDALNYTYRADVTDLVAGNGTYTVAGFPSGPAETDTQGASLVVLYYDPAQPRVGSVIVRDGAITSGPPSRSDTFTGLDVPELESAWLHNGVGDGQSGLTDPILSFHVEGNSFMNLGFGLATPNGPFTASAGSFWDDRPFNVLPRLNNAGTTTARWQAGAGGDCLVWAYTALVMTEPFKEPPPQVGFNTCRAVGLEGRDLRVTLVRSGGSGPASVDLSHLPGSATAGTDYTAPAAQTLTWAAGDVAPRQIVIPIASDGIPEPVETFRLQLSNPQPADTELFPHALLEVGILDGDEQGFRDSFESDCPM